ncbi:hypothetical protein FJT64_002890 [Amphibalanus amphitrite]|uniref:Uncharacterized protein n=1 Tax=Amphibalanus amphitrite TaxID=1232801 RepID=A0A6A4WIR7_AMPAM|nr:hypothetical protein FJT64_002890 [Amphibalanus amphitrite]
MRRDHAAAERVWKAEKASLEAELSVVKRELAELRRAIGEAFTDTQVSRLQTKGQKQWTEEDIVRALSIRCVSLWCYRYLRDTVYRVLGHWSRALELTVSSDGSTVTSAATAETIRLLKC